MASATSVYLDCNASTPMEPAIVQAFVHWLQDEPGNPASRTHEYGNRAKQAVQHARDQVAAVVKAQRDEVIFTSGATESNNLAILGLALHGQAHGKRHLISSQIEHKAVLEPLDRLASQGFEITLLPPTSGGWIDPEALRSALRPDTLLVSLMHVNNETGVIQPLEACAEVLSGHPSYFHVDAAQGFGKCIEPLQNPRIDLISVSGHKIYGPKGIGALIVRRRGFERVPLTPLMVGGGQERGLRPGTLPAPMIIGLGMAAELALKQHRTRETACLRFRARLLEALEPLHPVLTGDQDRVLHNTLNLRIPGVDSEAVMLALKGIVAISNGSACTSSSYTPSHVLHAMGMNDESAQEALRFSWCHMTPEPDWQAMREAIERVR